MSNNITPEAPAAVLRQPPNLEAHELLVAETLGLGGQQLQNYLNERGLLGVPDPEAVIMECNEVTETINGFAPVVYFQDIMPPDLAEQYKNLTSTDVNAIFVRDGGALLPNGYVISRFGPVRDGETGYLEAALRYYGGNILDLNLTTDYRLEGGDFRSLYLPDSTIVFVGVGGRTTNDAAKAIHKIGGQDTTVVVPHPEGLHLDTVFGPVSGSQGKTALVAEGVFDQVIVYQKGHERTGKEMAFIACLQSIGFGEDICVPLDNAINKEACNGLQGGGTYVVSDGLGRDLAKQAEQVTGVKMILSALEQTNLTQGGVNCTSLELDEIVVAGLRKQGLVLERHELNKKLSDVHLLH